MAHITCVFHCVCVGACLSDHGVCPSIPVHPLSRTIETPPPTGSAHLCLCVVCVAAAEPSGTPPRPKPVVKYLFHSKLRHLSEKEQP